jgi:hypothetical protein
MEFCFLTPAPFGWEFGATRQKVTVWSKWMVGSRERSFTIEYCNQTLLPVVSRKRLRDLVAKIKSRRIDLIYLLSCRVLNKSGLKTKRSYVLKL